VAVPDLLDFVIVVGTRADDFLSFLGFSLMSRQGTVAVARVSGADPKERLVIEGAPKLDGIAQKDRTS